MEPHEIESRIRIALLQAGIRLGDTGALVSVAYRDTDLDATVKAIGPYFRFNLSGLMTQADFELANPPSD